MILTAKADEGEVANFLYGPRTGGSFRNTCKKQRPRNRLMVVKLFGTKSVHIFAFSQQTGLWTDRLQALKTRLRNGSYKC